MRCGIAGTHSLCRIPPQQLGNEVPRPGGSGAKGLLLKVGVSTEDALASLLLRWRREGRAAEEHLVGQDAKAPIIDAEAVPACSFDHLWRHVVHGSAECPALLPRVAVHCPAEVCQLDF